MKPFFCKLGGLLVVFLMQTLFLFGLNQPELTLLEQVSCQPFNSIICQCGCEKGRDKETSEGIPPDEYV